MAPEILNETLEVDYRVADVYSFGIILWELYTREQPYFGLRYVSPVLPYSRLSSIFHMLFLFYVLTSYSDVSCRQPCGHRGGRDPRQSAPQTLPRR